MPVLLAISTENDLATATLIVDSVNTLAFAENVTVTKYGGSVLETMETLAEFVGEIGEADILMVDTAIKDGKNLFDFVTVQGLQELNDQAHDHGLKTVFAGSIRLRHLPTALETSPDYLGFRGVFCNDNEASREKTEELWAELRRLRAC